MYGDRFENRLRSRQPGLPLGDGALLVGWQSLKLGDRIAEGAHWVGQTLVPRHVSIGVLLLALAIPRLLRALNQRRQRPAPDEAMARSHGRCPKGERLCMGYPHGHRKTTTLVAGLRLDGMVAPRAIVLGPMADNGSPRNVG